MMASDEADKFKEFWYALRAPETQEITYLLENGRREWARRVFESKKQYGFTHEQIDEFLDYMQAVVNWRAALLPERLREIITLARERSLVIKTLRSSETYHDPHYRESLKTIEEIDDKLEARFNVLFKPESNEWLHN